jgi:hypothetical protein
VKTKIVAMDAIQVTAYAESQFSKKLIDRELKKVYIACLQENISKLATGHWGCGAFRGEYL